VSPRSRRLLVETAVLVVVATIAALLLKAFVAQAFYIPSASMEPQLQPGDRVIVSRIAYRLHDPRRGDIVVFDAPDAPAVDDPILPIRLVEDVLEGVGLRRPDETELIKRVIGLPGEVVEARSGRIVIDGRELREPYLSPDVATYDFGPVTVPDGTVYVLGDNRGDSADSRVIGPVRIDSIVGRAIVRAWPPWRWAWL